PVLFSLPQGREGGSSFLPNRPGSNQSHAARAAVLPDSWMAAGSILPAHPGGGVVERWTPPASDSLLLRDEQCRGVPGTVLRDAGAETDGVEAQGRLIG